MSASMLPAVLFRCDDHPDKNEHHDPGQHLVTNV